MNNKTIIYMKNIEIYIGSLILILNIVLGAIISSFSLQNIVLTSIVIIVTIILIHIINKLNIKDGFKYSFMILFPLFSIIQYTLCLLAPSSIKDNWNIIICTIILFFEIILVTLSQTLSKKD